MPSSKADVMADVALGSLLMACVLILASFGVEFWRADARMDLAGENARLSAENTRLRAELDAVRRGELKADGLPRIPPQNLPLE